MDAVTRLLADLVAIPSVNPMGRAVSGPEYLERGIGEYLGYWFDGLGVRYERQCLAPGRDNLIARFDAPGSRRTVLFDAHQDTVPVDGMTIPPFRPAVEVGRMYGRGSCDVKGGMAAMLSAFARLVRERPSGAASVVMACTVDEEFTHIGSSHLAARPSGADYAVVAEPTRLRVVNCHKGAVRWKVRTRGVACHSSTPGLGCNAIYRMTEVVGALAAHAGELAESTPDPVLGPPSLSVGRIEGGQSVNVVPDWCEIEVDRRLIPGETPAEVIRRARQAVQSRLGGDFDFGEFLPPWVNMPALAAGRPEASGWVDRLRDGLIGVLGSRPEVAGVPYGTDAGPLAEAGLPSVVFGPGDIAQAHTKDEWVDLDEVRTAAEAYYAIALALNDEGATPGTLKSD